MPPSCPVGLSEISPTAPPLSASPSRARWVAEAGSMSEGGSLVLVLDQDPDPDPDLVSPNPSPKASENPSGKPSAEPSRKASRPSCRRPPRRPARCPRAAAELPDAPCPEACTPVARAIPRPTRAPRWGWQARCASPRSGASKAASPDPIARAPGRGSPGSTAACPRPATGAFRPAQAARARRAQESARNGCPSGGRSTSRARSASAPRGRRTSDRPTCAG